MLQWLFISVILGSGFTGFTEITETGIDGCRATRTIVMIDGEILEGTGQIMQETFEPGGTDLSPAVLWVDRNHQNAIANETVICRDGEGILVSWYLNNDRISRYYTHGTETPLWNFSMPANGWKMDVAAGQDTMVFSAASTAEGVFAWLSPSSVPTLSLDPGAKQDISRDGLYLVYINASGDSLICVDTTTGSEIWKTSLYVAGTQKCGVDICGDGSRVLVSVRDDSSGCQVYDMLNGSLVGTPVGNDSQTIARISDDGARFIRGDIAAAACIYFYEFDGVSWIQVLEFNTGLYFVTAVAISGDGETAAGGTLHWPWTGKVIAFDWPAGGSPIQMWEYGNYGDEVSSVDINEDGSVIVAGSWGQYEGTYGDVFTAFNRNGSIIFNLLDDIDEPGSIYSVSVSSDGFYATASGKAVHARTYGNGGEVYSINLGSTAINRPEITTLDQQVYWMGEPYPNPSISQMNIEFHIPVTGMIDELAVYSLNGRRVAVLNSETTPGEYLSVWNLESDSGESLSPGLYLIRMSAAGAVISRKLMIIN